MFPTSAVNRLLPPILGAIWERLERLFKFFEPPRVERGKNFMECMF